MNQLIQSNPTTEYENTLINAIYDAAMHPQLWPQVLDAIREFCGADQCTLFYYDGIEQHNNYAAAARVKMQTLNLYLAEFIAPQAEQLNNQLACLPEGQVITDNDISRLSGNNYSQIVGDKYMQKLWPNLQFQAGAVLLRTATTCAGLGLQNTAGSLPLNIDQIARLQTLIPHLIQAIHIRQRITRLEKANAIFETVLKHVRLGVVLLDENELLTFINPEAMRAFSQCNSIAFNMHQRLELPHLPMEAYTLPCSTQTSQKNRKRKLADSEVSIKIDCSQGHLKLSFFIIGNAYTKTCGHTVASELPVNAHYLILVQDSRRPCELPIQYLKQAYGITPAESELITHMVNGASLQEAAEKRAITHETARWQMKNILQKTQMHSQTQLSQLMLSLSDS